MNLHEYQAKELLKSYGIFVPDFAVASSVEEVADILDQTGWDACVLKVQIHAGGRGAAGGVKIAKGTKEILSTAKELLGKKIVNAQTGKEGLIAHQILLSPLAAIKREYYLGLTIDRALGRILLIASPVGGVEIEKTAEKEPDHILMLPLPKNNFFLTHHLQRVAKFMGWKGDTAKQGMKLISHMTEGFIKSDATLLEINPLAETEEGQLAVLDVKWVIDDNALFRHDDLKALFDVTQISPLEARAQTHDLAYVALDGNIGCMVNGAGLAMATMDIIAHFGGKAANFLDVGGGATEEKVAEGFKIILSDPKVKAILVNIFGGIMDCKVIASGIIDAVRQLNVHVPLVVRLEGTHVEEGKALLKDSGLNIFSAQDIKSAAEQVVSLAKERGHVDPRQ